MVGYPMKRDWDEPKVLLNAQAGSRGPWRLFAAVDYDAVLVTQAFHVAWPRSETTPVQVIAAIINGPVANAWVCQKDDKRHNKVGTCRRIPIPDMNRLDQDMVVRKADRLQAIHALRGWQDASRNSEFQRLLHEVDALILEAYDLPGDMADGLFSLFTGAGRRKIVTNDYGKRHMEAKESLLREYAQDRRIERYQELITRKYVVGLEAAEAAEVARLEAEMDEYDAPFYEAMLSRMRERGAPSEVTH